MIRWCSYCASYLGEKEPFQNYQITHGICKNCNIKFKTKDENQFNWEKINLLKSFFSNLQDQAKEGIIATADLIIDEGLKIGIKPYDLIIGILQPLLREIGELYEKNKITVEKEHLFSYFSNQVIDSILSRQNLSFNKNEKYKVLLMSAKGNYHLIGLRFLEVYLKSNGINCISILNQISNEDVINIILKIKPKILAISVSLENQLIHVNKLINDIKQNKKISHNLKISIGGSFLSTDIKKNININNVDFIANPNNIQLFVDFVFKIINDKPIYKIFKLF